MSKVTLEQLGALIKEQRGQRGLREIAREIGISAATLSRVESGKQPDLETFSRLCSWLNINPGEVLGFVPSESSIEEPDALSQTVFAHFKAERSLKPETGRHLGELIIAVHKHAEKLKAGG